METSHHVPKHILSGSYPFSRKRFFLLFSLLFFPFPSLLFSLQHTTMSDLSKSLETAIKSTLEQASASHEDHEDHEEEEHEEQEEQDVDDDEAEEQDVVVTYPLPENSVIRNEKKFKVVPLPTSTTMN